MLQIGAKVIDLLSSPSKRDFESFQRGTIEVLEEGALTAVEKEMLYKRVQEITNKKPFSRARLQKGGAMTKEEAQKILDQEDREKAAKELRKQDKALQKVKKDAQTALYRLGIKARRIDRLRKKEIINAEPDDIGLAHLMVEIPDPETLAKVAYEATLPGFQLDTQLAEQERYKEEAERREQEEEELSIVIDHRERLHNPFVSGESYIVLDAGSDSSDSEIDNRVYDNGSDSSDSDDEDYLDM
jgi:hypothetical protein